MARAKLIELYGTPQSPLNIVAITDGARDIRLCLSAIFGKPIPLILEGYHLTKKVTELMSMIARHKAEKEQHVHQLLFYLWRGEGEAASAY